MKISKSKEKTVKSEEKQFSLKGVELQMVGNINQRHNAELVDMLSFIAMERLAYNVTSNTQFRIDEKGNMFISERPEEKPTEEEVATA